MQFIKAFNINNFSSAVRSGQLKLQQGQLVYCNDSDKKNLSVYVGHTKHTIHCIHGGSTAEAVADYRAYKKRIDALVAVREAKAELKRLEAIYHSL